MICPLCKSSKIKEFIEYKEVVYHTCEICELIFMDKKFHVSNEKEKSRYEKHQNNELTDGYKAFLYKIVDKIKIYSKASENGLDFGSGPYPMMENLLAKENLKCESYDPYFNSKKLNESYDFIVLNEVAEHFNNPYVEFDLIFKKLLKKNGFCYIQTGIYTENIDFKGWHYKNDLTHVCFYRHKTIDIICDTYNLKMVENTNNVIVLQRK
ncbi:MAG: class I SAM-dependent methyltransferase [Bacteriovoracaceae bacterium]|jgi:hypothetical protein|nr:class I SAM-dependent methyltransferase [Bacteriovoracaceae bacterium]